MPNSPTMALGREAKDKHFLFADDHVNLNQGKLPYTLDMQFAL